MTPNDKHLILMPAYNPGPILEQTVRSTLEVWGSLWVVVDGSTDGSEAPLRKIEREEPGFRLMVNRENRGKGAAVLQGATVALREGFSHALVMDCDGQHPVESIKRFMEISMRSPESMILGQPVFGSEAPLERLMGRRISVGLARIEVMGPWVGDPLFGFRVYPLKRLVEVLARPGRGRRYDFDHETVVRLHWQGVPALKVSARCRYLEDAEGGVSHFHYVRDNLRFAWLHMRLLSEWFVRLPRSFRRRDPGPAIETFESSNTAGNSK